VFFACLFLTVAAFVLLNATGWIDARTIFPGLPEPPPIDTGGLPGDPFGQFEIPEEIRPGEAIPLRGMVQPRPLFGQVPVPQQLSTEPRVVGANLFLAILMALVFGATSSILSNMLRDEEPRIQAWLRALGITQLVEWIRGLFGWTLSRGIRRGCLTLPLVLLIFGLYGIIFAFLERGTSIFSREGALLAVTLAFSVGLVSFAGDFARRLVAWLYRERSSFNLYPVNLVIAAATVALSRIVNLSPGIVFGTPGGADIEDSGNPAKEERRNRALGITTILTLVVIGGLGWAATGVVVNMLDVPFEGRVAQVVARALTGATNLGLAIFLVALQTSFFELLPYAYSSGQPIFRWSKIVWVLFFTPIAFLFAHALLNPQYGFLDSFRESEVRFLWLVMLLLVAVTAALWFYFNVIDDVLKEWAGINRPRRTPQQYPPYPPHSSAGTRDPLDRGGR
jgi:hypothetical protein